MKKRELSVLIAGGLAASFMLNNVQVVKADDYNTQVVSEKTEEPIKDSEEGFAKDSNDELSNKDVSEDISKNEEQSDDTKAEQETDKVSEEVNNKVVDESADIQEIESVSEVINNNIVNESEDILEKEEAQGATEVQVSEESQESEEIQISEELKESTEATEVITESAATTDAAVILDEVGEENSDFIYLSDIQYDESQSKAGYGTIQKDANIEGGKITLIVDGEGVEFERGMAAHATSTLVYDIRSYKDKYSRFISFVGIDKSKYGIGNGVKFSIYTSEDGSKWTLAKNIGLLTSDGECAYVDIDISGANYIKLYADDNGADGCDHAVYGDAKLASESYGGESISSDILMEVSEYDEILRNYSIDENMKNNEITILRRDFVNKIGYDSIRRLAAQSTANKEAIQYLLEDETALRYFVTSGPVNPTGSYTASVKYFADIYEKYADELKSGKEDNFHLRMALSISLAYAKEDLSRFWIGNIKNRNSVKRYEIYKELISKGLMDEGGKSDGDSKWSSTQFKQLPVPLMKWVMSNRLNDDEILWLADYALDQKNKGKDFFNAYNYINYTDGYDYDRDSLYDSGNYDKYNKKYNFGSYIDDYGTKGMYRLWMVFEEGSVCGGLAKTYSNLATTFGRPSSVVGQPGHAATITYAYNKSNARYEWIIQNDISGWVESGNEYTERLLGWGNESWSKWYSASYAVLATDAVNDYDNLVKAAELNILAHAYDDNDMKKEAYSKALEIQDINVDSMEGLINTYKSDSSMTSSDYFELGKKIIDTYTYYPQAMVELLELIKGEVTIADEVVQLDLLENNALLRASSATANESTCVLMTKQLAESYLGTINNELASFSFDGENAGKIMINSKYDGSQIRVRYSFDGGVNWTNTDSHQISLTQEQLSSINSTDDIMVGLVGTDEVFVIDILESKVISDTSIYKNDLENLLIGETENLEFSLDGGNTWCDYVSGLDGGTRFKGNKAVKVRYKSYGHYLQGNVYEYEFKEDSNTPEKSYLQLKNVTLVDFASQQNNTSHAGANFIDGNYNTTWHTTFGYKEPVKYYTVSFDKIRYITALEYTPGGGYNGKVKSADVYTSFDGETWVKAGSVTNLASDNTVKTINLNNPTACKYLKIVATETYGNSAGEADYYFSGRMLNFYEDSTKTYNAEATIEYSTTEFTNEEVTATVVLPEGCTIIGDSSHVFSTNGSFTFEFLDGNNVKQTVEANVDWIDKEAPTAEVQYDINYWTNNEVTATLVDLSEEVTFLNGSTYTFEDNGDYTFEYVDKAGNKGTATAEVNWIYKNKPQEEVTYSTKEETSNPVTVSLQLNLNDIEILNNDGKAEVVFEENGEFIFKLRLKSTGYEFELPIKVDWIKEGTQDTDDSKDDNLGTDDKTENGDGSGSEDKIEDKDNSGNNDGSGSNKKPGSHSGSSNSSENDNEADDNNNDNEVSTDNSGSTDSNKSGWSMNEDKIWSYYKDGNTLKSQWLQDNSWYYLNEEGRMVTGWNKISDTWYHFNTSGAMETGWIQEGGSWYYLKESGAMASGWIKDKESWYYLNRSGAMHTGWVNDNGTWYYLKESGAMAKGWIQDNGSWYYLNESGAMLYNTIVNGYVLGASGAWIR